jgi:hypothetical protein
MTLQNTIDRCMLGVGDFAPPETKLVKFLHKNGMKSSSLHLQMCLHVSILHWSGSCNLKLENLLIWHSQSYLLPGGFGRCLQIREYVAQHQEARP